MYNPPHFETHDVAQMHALMVAHPLGTWITQVDGRLVVNHLPFLLDARRGAHGTLTGHVSRANPAWMTAADSESVVVFHGAQAYITPTWYATKAETGKSVPTWNYAVVHARGTARVIDDTEWLRAHVAALTQHHEAREMVPWDVGDAPADYIASQLKGIVGIEIPIDRFDGKWKMSQNRTASDRQGVVRGLEQRGDDTSVAVAAAVRERGRSE